MTNRTCVQCEKPLPEGVSERTKFCSAVCRSWSAWLGPGGSKHCMECGSPMLVSKTSKRGPGRCAKCSKHGLGGYGRGCRCDTCRSAKNDYQRRFNAAVKARDGVSASSQAKRKRRGLDPLAPPRNCGSCGKPVAMDRGSEVPYHRECRDKVPAWKREGRESPKVAAFRRKIQSAAEGTTGGARVFYAGPCSWCGRNPSVRFGWYCSRTCKAMSGQSRRGKFAVSRQDRLAIYERDGWMCQLCWTDVEKGAPLGSPWSPSLDHVIPQSTQLIPDHSPGNLRLAHLWCNAARGDGSGVTMSLDEVRVRALQMRFEVAA